MNLEFYNDSHKKYINEYSMSNLQLEYASHPKKMLKDDKYDYYILGFVDEKLTNFLALKTRESKNELLIKGFSTDENNLRCGYGLWFLSELREFTLNNIAEIDRISLEVNMENKKAIDLYKKGNYIETDNIRYGKKGVLQYMYLDIKKK